MSAIGLLGLASGLFAFLIWVIDYDARHGWKEVRDSCSNEFDN